MNEMIQKIMKTYQAKQNLKRIQTQKWEFREINEEMARILPKLNSVEQLLKDIYEYAYTQAFLNEQALEHIQFSIEHKKINHRHSRDSYWDLHFITIKYEEFVYQLVYRFDKMPRWNLAGDNAVVLPSDGLWYVQVYLKKGKGQLPLLKESRDLKRGFIFTEDVPEKVQNKVNQVYSFVQQLKNEAILLQQAKLQARKEKTQRDTQKRIISSEQK